MPALSPPLMPVQAMNPIPAHSYPRAQRGVGLIEILISVLVLSIGLLGVASVQTRALATNNGAAARSMAVVASYDILEAMRADITAARSGNYNTTVAANDCPSVGTLMETQISNWCNQLATTLGADASTTGQINCDSAGVGDCTVTINYDDSRIGDGIDAQSVVTKSVL